MDTAGEGYLASPNVDINNAGDVMASWFHGLNPSSSESVDVVPGTVAGGFGSVEHPTGLDASQLYYTTINTVLDSTGRTTLSSSPYVSGKIRSYFYTRAHDGTWAGPQTPLVATNHTYGNRLAAAPNGRVMAVIERQDTGSSTIFTTTAEPGQDFVTAKDLVSGVTGLQRETPVFGASGDGVLAWVHDENSAQVTDAVGYDASPPQLNNFVLPAAGTVGSPLDFSVQPLDIWGPVTTTWNFDGVSADGAAQSHAFGSSGDKQVSVTATDALGNAASRSGTVAVAPAALPAGSGGPTPTADTTAPLVTAFAFVPSSFAVGKAATPFVARKVPRGSTLGFTASEAGAARVAIARELPGLKSGNRCVAPKKGKTGKKCTRLKAMGTLSRRAVAGANRFPFSGRLGKRALGVGRYRAAVVVTDAAGNKSQPALAKFKIVPAR